MTTTKSKMAWVISGLVLAALIANTFSGRDVIRADEKAAAKVVVSVVGAGTAGELGPDKTVQLVASAPDKLADVAPRVVDRCGAPLELGASKGTITIDFATVGDLNRIMSDLGVAGELGR